MPIIGQSLQRKLCISSLLLLEVFFGELYATASQVGEL
jgi:hypothetical protein